MEDKEDDKKQGSCEQRWSHKFVNDTWPREKRRRKSVLHTVYFWDFTIQWTSNTDLKIWKVSTTSMEIYGGQRRRLKTWLMPTKMEP